MSSEDIPKVPERPVRKRTPNEGVASETSRDASIPPPSNRNSPTYEEAHNSPEISSMHHQRARTTTPTLPTVPPTRPLLKAKTTGNIPQIGAPQLPNKRPVKRSTTQNLDDLVQSTNEQLKEMEKLISKHCTDSAENIGTVVDEDAIGDKTSLGLDKERDNLYESGLRSKEYNDSKPEEMFENTEKGSQVDFTTSSEANVQQLGLHGQGNDLNLDEPLGSFTKPFGTEDTKDIDTQAAVSSARPESEDPAVTFNNVEAVHKRPERASSPEAIKVVASQSPFPDNAETTSDEGTKSAVPSIPARPRRKAHKDDTSKYDFQNEMESTGKDVIRENSQEAPSVSENIEMESTEKDITKEAPQEAPSVSENIETSLKPETSKKRAAPPVPKKPSSRIAAFQEMLQKQQLEQLQGSVPSSSLATFSAHATDSSRPSVPRRPSHPNKSALNEEKAKFAHNLNGLFPLPGMAPAGRMPASLSKKLGQTSSKDEDTAKDARLPDVHRQRAKGPRGRKLPSKVTNVEKITGESKSNEIEVFNTWSVVQFSKRMNSTKLHTNDSPEAEISQKPVERMQDEVNEGIQERRPSLSGRCLLGESAVPCEQEPFINETESLKNNGDGFDSSSSSKPYDICDQDDTDLRGTTTAQAIDDRNQTGLAEALENCLEKQSERESENETLADTGVVNNDRI